MNSWPIDNPYNDLTITAANRYLVLQYVLWLIYLTATALGLIGMAVSLFYIPELKAIVSLEYITIFYAVVALAVFLVPASLERTVIGKYSAMTGSRT